MANKKVSQLVSKPSVLVTDLFPIADPTTGQLFKTTISDLGTAIGSGVSSVNTLVGAVVLDTDDIQELASPTNRWFTDTRARAAISGGTGISYNSGTGVITNAVTSGQIATALGYTPANGADYLPLAGGTMGGAIFGTTATFASSTSVTALGITLSGASGDGVKITHSAGRAFNLQSSGSGFGILINNETASTSAPFTIQKQGLAVITLTDAGAGSFASSLTANSFVKASGTSSQFLKADGSVDSTSYQPTLTNPVTGTGTSGIVAKFSGTSAITDSIIYDNGTRVSIGANVTTSNTFTSVSSTTSAYAVVAQASGAANGFWAVLSGTGEIFRGQTNGGSYFIINNGGNAFLNGNLNVGDFASTSYKLNVVGTANITGALSGTSATFSSSVTSESTGVNASLRVKNTTATTGVDWHMYSLNNGNFGLYNNTSGNYAYNVTSGGNVGIGTTSPSYTLDIVKAGTNSIRVQNTADSVDAFLQTQNTAGSALFGINSTGPYIYTAGALALQLYTNNAERMRITSGGNLLIGTTTDAGERLRVNGNLRALSLYASDAGLSAGNWIRLGHDDNVGFIDVNRAINSGDLHFRFDNTSRANINRSTGAYTATSDSRLKTNILDSQNVLSLIEKIKVRRYNWIENNSFEPYGLIAQELHEILPEYVYKPKTEIESWGLSKAELVPVLIKAIQELKAELDTYTGKNK